MAKKKKSQPQEIDAEELTFEQSLAELEEIVRRLEEGELTMDEALSAYEKGIGRLKRCYRLLDAAEQKIAVLTGVDADGNPVTEPFAQDE